MRSIIHGLVTFLLRLRSGAIELNNRRYERRVDEILRRDGDFRTLPDEELRRHAATLRQRVHGGTPLDRVVVDAFAIVKEAARRTVGMQPYDVQLLAGLALHDRRLVEMQTGEGKTLAAVPPAALRACLGRGVHVLTYNDYLAARDAEWMGPIYRFLGLTVGHVEQGMPSAERRAAYACDVTYATAKEAGFDFLRDQLSLAAGQMVQRGFHYAIVDEADSILIDEARVPLVIAGPAEDDHENLYRLAGIVRTLRPAQDFSTDEGWRNVSFNSAGLNRLQRELKCGELHTEENADLLTRLNLALQAEVLLRRDVDYLVRDGAVELIDELTGRVAENRRWPYGLQAAIEAKEQLKILPQGKILNSITLQHFLEQYECLSGMTGTAQEAAEELYEFYDLKVVIVPPNRPCVRRDHADRVFPTKRAKDQAVAREIAAMHRKGRPVLVGTASVEESERLAAWLAGTGVSCRILNAKNDHQEAGVVAEAGSPGAVTISTNMAGRGTDIRLGGSDERDRERVLALGGLYVLGTNRNESRRIDNQLRGRAGRQGDPGESRFFVSVEDDLIHRHGIGDLIADLLKKGTGSESLTRRLSPFSTASDPLQTENGSERPNTIPPLRKGGEGGVASAERAERPTAVDAVDQSRVASDPSDSALDDPRIGRNIAHVQRVIEGESFEIRRTLRKYSYCLERQRRLMHERRQRLLCELETSEPGSEQHPTSPPLRKGGATEAADRSGRREAEGASEESRRTGGVATQSSDCPSRLHDRDPEFFAKLVQQFGENVIRKVERQITLCQIDRCWSEHLAHLAELRDGIHLVSIGGLNAFDEFNRQINAMYRDLSRHIDDEVLATFRTVHITPDGIDLEKEGLLGPSSTWTYMINDNPTGDILQRLLRGLKRMVLQD